MVVQWVNWIKLIVWDDRHTHQTLQDLWMHRISLLTLYLQNVPTTCESSTAVTTAQKSGDGQCVASKLYSSKPRCHWQFIFSLTRRANMILDWLLHHHTILFSTAASWWWISMTTVTIGRLFLFHLMCSYLLSGQFILYLPLGRV